MKLVARFLVAVLTLPVWAQLNLPPVTAAAYAPQAASVGSLNVSSGSQTLLSMSGGGWLSGIAVRVNTALTSATANVDVTINVDGAGAIAALRIFAAANLFSAAAAPLAIKGTGSTAGDIVFIPLNVAFRSSLVIQQSVSGGPDATGVLDWTIIRSSKL